MIKRYAIFDKDGFPIAFYSDDVHKDVPKNAIEIDHGHWREFLENQGQRKWNGEKPILYTVPDISTYAEKRAAEYPPVGDQLDAILKGFNQLRLGGIDLPADLDAVINKWLAVKEKHPKPEGKDA